MPRQKREWYEGAIYHVMSRGNRRLALFKDSDDYLIFLECILKARELYPFKIHSLCLMTNHFHMAIETADVELWKIMLRILHPYSMNFNRKHHFTGHLFEKRYTACLIEDDRYFLEASRYIHLNPVKAKMVNEPLAYEYSSYGWFVNDEKSQIEIEKTRQCYNAIGRVIETDRVLGFFRNNAREQYRMFVEGNISHDEQELLIQKDMNEDDLWLPW